MNPFLAVLLFVVGLVLVIFFAEKLVKGAVGTSAGFGVSTFVISVLFIGFDPENLAVGAAGSFEDVGGIALGSIIGAAGLAFGVAALIVPLKFEAAPRRILALPVLSVGAFAAVVWDGTLSRVDGILLLVVFAVAIAALLWMSTKGIDIRPGREVAENSGRSREAR